MPRKHKFNELQKSVTDHVEEMLTRYPRKTVGDMPSPLEYFEDLNLPDGDFKWEADEPDDWDAYQCGEKDCEVPGGWHKIAGGENIGRTNGKLWMESWTVDEDGDQNDTVRWDEGDSIEMFQEVIFDLAQDDHFISWAKYCLWCAENGQDPLNESIGLIKPREWVNFWLDGALMNLRYLYMGLK